MKQLIRYSLLCIGLLSTCMSTAQQLLNVGVAGLSHDHVHLLMHQFKEGKVHIAGIAESDTALIARYKKSYHLPDSLFYPSLNAMLAKVHPDAVLGYNPVAEHILVVEYVANGNLREHLDGKFAPYLYFELKF